jgi:hypothetical protein
MADIGSPGGHTDTNIVPPNVSDISNPINGAQIGGAASSHQRGSMAAGPSSQGYDNISSNVVNESPRKSKTPIAAAAADRAIALQVWMNSAERDDDVRDALGRMMGWVEQLVSVVTVIGMPSRFDLVVLTLHAAATPRDYFRTSFLYLS